MDNPKWIEVFSLILCIHTPSPAPVLHILFLYRKTRHSNSQKQVNFVVVAVAVVCMYELHLAFYMFCHSDDDYGFLLFLLSFTTIHIVHMHPYTSLSNKIHFSVIFHSVCYPKILNFVFRFTPNFLDFPYIEENAKYKNCLCHFVSARKVSSSGHKACELICQFVRFLTGCFGTVFFFSVASCCSSAHQMEK